MTVSTDVRAYPRLSEAEALLRDGRNDEASFKVIEHLREHRDEPRGLALLGEIAMETGALVQAEQFLRRAIALGHESPAVEHSTHRIGDPSRSEPASSERTATC